MAFIGPSSIQRSGRQVGGLGRFSESSIVLGIPQSISNELDAQLDRSIQSDRAQREAFRSPWASPFIGRDGTDSRERFRFEVEKANEARASQAFAADQARKTEGFNIFKDFFTGASRPNFGNFDPVQDLLNQANSRRESIFTPGSSGRVDQYIDRENVDFGLNQAKDLTRGPESIQLEGLRAQAEAGLRQQFQSSLRSLRSSQGRGVSPFTSQARASDLINSRLQAQADLERGLVVDDLNRRQQATALFNDALAADIQRQQAAQQFNAQIQFNENMQRLGNPELGAQLRSDLERTRAAQVSTFLSQLQSIAGL